MESINCLTSYIAPINCSCSDGSAKIEVDGSAVAEHHVLWCEWCVCMYAHLSVFDQGDLLEFLPKVHQRRTLINQKQLHHFYSWSAGEETFAGHMGK